jgi:antitoxin HicB
MEYRYSATFEPDENGRILVRFADFPEALTDGTDLAEALHEAADCLSAALASRIVNGEEIPHPSSVEAHPNQHVISPSPTIALKAALYTALRVRDMTVADLADRMGLADWHQAARLIDPRRASKLTSLAAALAALNCEILLSVHDRAAIDARLNAQLHRAHETHLRILSPADRDAAGPVVPVRADLVGAHRPRRTARRGRAAEADAEK